MKRMLISLCLFLGLLFIASSCGNKKELTEKAEKAFVPYILKEYDGYRLNYDIEDVWYSKLYVLSWEKYNDKDIIPAYQVEFTRQSVDEIIAQSEMSNPEPPFRYVMFAEIHLKHKKTKERETAYESVEFDSNLNPKRISDLETNYLYTEYEDRKHKMLDALDKLHFDKESE